MDNSAQAIVIISNGPGELSTWVKPLVEELHAKILMRPCQTNSSTSLRLVLVPCPNGTGKEKKVAENWGQFEIITSPSNFWDLLIRPRKYGVWPKKGIVIFLGGDQFWSVLLSARLGYFNMTYAEWVARWPFWNDRIFAMSSEVLQKMSRAMRRRCVVVGDLMADLGQTSKQKSPLPANGKWVALMPGSKAAKLRIGIPFFLELADKLSTLIPDCKFILPIAPTTNLDEFKYFSSHKNKIANQYISGIKDISYENKVNKWKKIITKKNTEIYLKEDYPAHNELSQCDLALTTVGANTAELGALAIPMIVIIPTQHLNVMKAWDGLLGIIGRLPILEWVFSRIVSAWRLRKRRYMAWPNICSGRMLVPERIGKFSPTQIAIEASEWLDSPERLKGQKEELKSLRGKSGAVNAIVKEILEFSKAKNINL